MHVRMLMYVCIHASQSYTCVCYYSLFYINIAEYTEWHSHYGYKDAKPMYVAEGESPGEIRIRVNVTNAHANFALFCGSVKDSLKHTKFFVDVNVPMDVGGVSGGVAYTTSDKRVEWTHKKYLGGECKFLNALPLGCHVESIQPHNTPNQKHVTGLSHVIHVVSIQPHNTPNQKHVTGLSHVIMCN